MNFNLSDAQQATRARARRIAETFRSEAAIRDANEVFPLEQSQQLAAEGMMGVALPTQYGGYGGGTIDYALALHEVAGVCASSAVTMAVTNMVGEMIERFGRPDQKAHFFPMLTSGERPIGSFCLSEPQSGSDAAALSARAERRGNEFVLNGTKMWVTSGAYCSVAPIMARTADHKSKGITTFLVEADNPGYIPAKAEDKMGLRASNTVAVSLEDCVVDESCILANEGDGFKIAMTALDGGRIGIGAQALGIARSALTATVRWLHTNGDVDQAAEFALADAATQLDAGWLMMLRAAYLREQGTRMTREAAMAKVFATESAGKVVDLCMDITGETGLRADFDLERYARDVRVTRIYEGTSEIRRLVIARELLKGNK